MRSMFEQGDGVDVLTVGGNVVEARPLKQQVTSRNVQL
jgi:hypothetical protein